MKKFEFPEIEVIAFEVEDIVTTSGGLDSGNNGTGWQPL